MTINVTTDFREEYEVERTVWLWRRCLWYTAVLGSFYALAAVIRLGWTITSFGTEQWTSALMLFLHNLPILMLFWSMHFYVKGRALRRRQLDLIIFWLIVLSGSYSIIAAPFIEWMAGQPVTPVRSLELAFAAHFMAALFIPWSPREATRPLVPLLAIFAVVTVLFSDASTTGKAGYIALSPIIGIPGLIIAWWRHSRFRQRFHYRMLTGRYGELTRELVDARRVHESVFPGQLEQGAVTMRYAYLPMRQIGGDYLHLHRPDPNDPQAPISVIMLDVTGHGIPAALTVHRLHGEIERLYAEDPDLEPGAMLRALNRYIYLTLARSGIYGTGICLRLDPGRDQLIWASGGHPPAFKLSAAGKIDRLDATSYLLGAVPDDVFDGSQQSIHFGPGDALICYTDGAIESRDQQGTMLRIEGLERMLASLAVPLDAAPRRLCVDLVNRLNERRFGPSADDTLIVEVHRPVSAETPARRSTADRARVPAE